jgi:hypothetical protein
MTADEKKCFSDAAKFAKDEAESGVPPRKRARTDARPANASSERIRRTDPNVQDDLSGTGLFCKPCNQYFDSIFAMVSSVSNGQEIKK